VAMVSVELATTVPRVKAEVTSSVGPCDELEGLDNEATVVVVVVVVVVLVVVVLVVVLVIVVSGAS
jgi:hypothetical protein